jgi:Tol biopolymer transport system component
MRVIPFTGSLGHEDFPVFSPYGNQIAFVWDGPDHNNYDIYVKLIDAGKELRLTQHPAADLAPAWSPDGRYVAFLRPCESETEVVLVSALGGPERKLCTASGRAGIFVSLAWSPDGKFLAFPDRSSTQEPYGIYLLSVDSLDKRRLTFPPVRYRDFPTGDMSCVFSPDGQSLAFVRWNQSVSDLYVVPISGGELKRLTLDNRQITGLDWLSRRQEIVFSSDRGGSFALWKISTAGGKPERLTIGADNAYTPRVCRQGNRLAYVQRTDASNIWYFEIPSAGHQRQQQAKKLTYSTQHDSGPQYSPDGKRVVFASDRSGSNEIWMCDSVGSNLVQLTSFAGPEVGVPRWSPDGREITFTGSVEDQADIYVINTEDRMPRRLTSEPSDEVVSSWSKDGRSIYFSSNRSGKQQLWKMPSHGGPASQLTKEGGISAFESPDGKFLYFSKSGAPGIWKMPVGGGQETQVLENLKAGYWGYWGLSKDGIYYFDGDAKGIAFFNFSTRRSASLLAPVTGLLRWNPGMAVSPDGRQLLYTQMDGATRRIMLVENFR